MKTPLTSQKNPQDDAHSHTATSLLVLLAVTHQQNFYRIDHKVTQQHNIHHSERSSETHRATNNQKFLFIRTRLKMRREKSLSHVLLQPIVHVESPPFRLHKPILRARARMLLHELFYILRILVLTQPARERFESCQRVSTRSLSLLISFVHPLGTHRGV